ncbi:hypothetical protein TL16_g00350 [Triparma laevis f. inornata]|uniref:COMM domain-containing protein n=2 Tax=Triparma laevis TaxID=1534972 RepID=A0A9W7FI87_9STRA|nr:hypothetical protein TL16_g00350 [Triparma laevis f. inornata]GMI12518.1 hypothetical protein TrLO_g12971 [Triparma laevis f. longispina]
MSSFTTLSDFDYSVSVSLSSSTVSSTRQPLVLLKLTLKNPDGTERDEIIEMDKEGLEGFLKELGGIEEKRREILGEG